MYNLITEVVVACVTDVSNIYLVSVTCGHEQESVVLATYRDDSQLQAVGKALELAEKLHIDSITFENMEG